jgi:flagellar biosynthesis protein FlhA
MLATSPAARFGGASAALALPIGIFALLALMVLPIPALLLDIFFVLNIAISIAVLMVALNARRPLDFSSFPSVLLFTTLLRLAQQLQRAAKRCGIIANEQAVGLAFIPACAEHQS